MFSIGKQATLHVTDLLSAYVDNQLNDREHERVETHLRSCAACAADLRALRSTVTLLHALPVAPAPRAFVLQPTYQPYRPSRFLPLLRLATSLTAAALVLSLAGSLFSQSYQPAMSPAPLASTAQDAQTALLEAAPRQADTESVAAAAAAMATQAAPVAATPTPMAATGALAAPMAPTAAARSVAPAAPPAPVALAATPNDAQKNTATAAEAAATATVTPSATPAPPPTPAPTATPVVAPAPIAPTSFWPAVQIGLGGLLVVLVGLTLVVGRRQRRPAA
jgi:hypothetical protein